LQAFVGVLLRRHYFIYCRSVLLQGERLQIILSTIKKHGIVRTDELARSLGASENSIRRDLRQLEERQIVNRIHGGAVLADHSGDTIVPLSERSHIETEQKRSIASAAAELVMANSTIVLDAGSTTSLLLRPSMEIRICRPPSSPTVLTSRHSRSRTALSN
jgi:DeoR/GlpR family transcriptional regulator of sugar metabolism